MYKYIISKHDLFYAVKVINRLPDAYDKNMNGYYKTLSEIEVKKLRAAHVI